MAGEVIPPEVVSAEMGSEQAGDGALAPEEDITKKVFTTELEPQSKWERDSYTGRFSVSSERYT